jgi:hypothetical protein
MAYCNDRQALCARGRDLRAIAFNQVGLHMACHMAMQDMAMAMDMAMHGYGHTWIARRAMGSSALVGFDF